MASKRDLESKDEDGDSPVIESVSAGDLGESKEEFLSSFTEAENKRIMRKVDRRFLVLIGMMYLIKNV